MYINITGLGLFMIDILGWWFGSCVVFYVWEEKHPTDEIILVGLKAPTSDVTTRIACGI